MCSFYDTTIVLVAVGITAAVCLGVTCFAVQTKYDFTMCGGLLFMLVLVLFMFGISCIIVYATVGYSYVSGLPTNMSLFPCTA
jgi:FtsH-binding integral membrane protein